MLKIKKWIVDKSESWIKLILMGVVLISLVGCSSQAGSDASAPTRGAVTKQGSQQQLVIYTGRDKSVVDYVIPKFEATHPDIKVDVLTIGAQEILERIRGEKSNPQADFWWGGTQSSLRTAALEGLLESYKPSFGDQIPAMYKDAQDRWYGEMLLPEVIMYNPQMLPKAEAPKDWDDLLDPKYKDKIIIRGVLKSGTMRTIYSAMMYRQGAAAPEKGYEWLAKLDANTKEYAQDPTSLYIKLARQEAAISLWNLQDILIQKEAKKQPFDYIYPASGAPILVDGVAIVKGTKNIAPAKKFYDFLYDEKLRIELAEKFYQIPALSTSSKENLPTWLQAIELKPLEMDWQVLADKEKEWMQYWDENIKGKGYK
ncbi:extracellular solute-binding protein [Brevibacillus laterosporus]|uniref:extracellular solute-binding protein n=1 Tax=Brevibacillus laterosporus TaxID=1465 RepID=UPI00215BD43B|nr:extracellular solute-binding protein [Brevibacillus laterosporus]MCR8995433.1 extracellular solute-binding protein [Brevibacillus laterosporus]